jgi:hypothetical protein
MTMDEDFLAAVLRPQDRISRPDRRDQPIDR